MIKYQKKDKHFTDCDTIVSQKKQFHTGNRITKCYILVSEL